MTRCAVKGCQNIKPQRQSGNLSFFSFPKNEIVCKAWVEACKNEKVNTKNGRVCSIHFLPTAYKEQTWYQKNFSLVYKPRLNDGAIPTENLDFDVIDTRNESALEEVENIEHEDFTALEQQNINANEESTTSKNQNSMPAKELQQIHKCKISNRRKGIPNESYDKVMQNNMILRKKLKASETANNKLMRKLKITNKMLEVRNRKILKLLDKERHYKETLERIFTPGQINILLDPKKKKTRWCAEDIAAAINLRSISPKAYRYLRTMMKIPLPSFSTLGKWAQTLNMEEGILKDVLLIMKQKAKTMKSFEKLAVISYDEVYISDHMSIDRKEEQVIGQHRTCQVVMARGLFSKWKQPVFYEYDKPVTKENLTKILKQLFDGFTVVAATSDLGPKNQSLWNDLNIDSEKGKCYFLHPSNNLLRVYIFADAPHMLKLARNHLLDHGFVYCGNIIDKKCFELLLKLRLKDLTIAHKLTKQHLDVVGTGRQKVKFAAQLFSHTNAKAIETCGKNGIAGFENWESLFYVLDLFDKWFDIFNSRTKYAKYAEAHAFGIEMEKQCKVLREMNEFITSMRVCGRNKLLPFQKGISLCCQSLSGLFKHLKQMYVIDDRPIEYLFTSRLNQDVLENCFSYLRGMGGANDHPNALDIRNRLRWYILGKHSTDLFSVQKNTDPDVTDSSLIKAHDMNSDPQRQISNAIPSTSTRNNDEDEDELLTNVLTLLSEDDTQSNPLVVGEGIERVSDVQLLELSDGLKCFEKDIDDAGLIIPYTEKK